MIFIYVIATLLLVIGIGLLALSVRSKILDEGDETPSVGRKATILSSFGLSAILFLSGQLFFYADSGYQYFLVYPNGSEDAVMTSGIKWRGFAKIQEFPKFFDIKTMKEGDDSKGIEGKINGGIDIRFVDVVTAKVYLSVRMQMPKDAKSFIELAKEFKHPDNLVNNTLVPTVKEQVVNSGYMFTAQSYISGSASDFRQTIDEQLKSGGYSVQRIEYKDTIIPEFTDIKNGRKIKNIKTRYEVRKRKSADGHFIRIPHDITKNNIIVSQCIVDQVMLEPAFRKRLEKQRDIVAQKQMEMQKIETAKAEQQSIIAQGERDKARERVEQEKAQVKKLIQIETKLKQEKTNLELAKIQLETERVNSTKEMVTADKEAYKNRKLVQAGLTPQERAKWEHDTKVNVAKELAKTKYPEILITGASGQGNSVLSTLLGAEYAKKMLLNESKK